MSTDRAVAFEFVEGLEKLDTVEAVAAAFSEAIAWFGFNRFTAAGLPLLHRPPQPLVLASTWPKEWFDRYVERNYFHIDPVCQAMRDATQPVLWADVPESLAKADGAAAFMAEAREMGLVDGYCVPVFSPAGWKSAVGLASDRPVDLSKPALAAVQFMANHALGRLRAIVAESLPQPVKLTAREREVLAWAAAGKSSQDTAQLLDLAVGTVNFHLARSREKLNAVTTTQAVAVAVRDGHLSF
jgi:LuxR family quorum sensing-dependent transcriptional regulator